MTALSVFNQGKIGKGELLAIAEQTLRLPAAPASAQSAAAAAAAAGQLPDLVAVFKSLILRLGEAAGKV